MKERGHENLLADWLKYCERYYTKRTTKHYKSCLNLFLQFIYQDGGIINTKAIEGYIDYNISGNWSNRTINSNLTAIKSFCRWQAKHEGIPNPAKEVPMLKEAPPRQRVLTQEEYDNVLKVASPRQRDNIEFIGHTGLRASEFASLQWENISPDRKYLTILGKGRKQRIVPLNQTCRDILKRHNNRTTFICNDRKNLGRMCRSLAKRAGISSFGAHAIRHYFATKLIKEGVSIYYVSKILGHSSVKTTEKIYIHLFPIDFIGLTDVLD